MKERKGWKEVEKEGQKGKKTTVFIVGLHKFLQHHLKQNFVGKTILGSKHLLFMCFEIWSHYKFGKLSS